MSVEKTEEFGPFPQTTFHHLPASEHLGDDLPYFARAEIEALVKALDAVEDFFLRQMRIAKRRKLHALAVHEIDGVVLLEPAVGDGVPIELRAGIGRGERNLYRVRVDLFGEFYGLLDGLARLARQAEDEGSVDLDAELAAVLGEAARDVGAQALLDDMQNSSSPDS